MRYCNNTFKNIIAVMLYMITYRIEYMTKVTFVRIRLLVELTGCRSKKKMEKTSRRVSMLTHAIDI